MDEPKVRRDKKKDQKEKAKGKTIYSGKHVRAQTTKARGS